MSLKSGGEGIGSRASFSDDIVLPAADQREARRTLGVPLVFLSKEGFDFWFWFFPELLAPVARSRLLAPIARSRLLAPIARSSLLAFIARFRPLASIACFRLLASIAHFRPRGGPTRGAG